MPLRSEENREGTLPVLLGNEKEPAEAGSLLKATFLVVRPTAREAVSAIDRLVSARLERNLGDTPALAAGCLEHFTCAAAPSAVRRASGFACRAALRAAARLVGKALHCEKLLFAGGERELLPAVSAGERFVCIH
jgi:hypothetical protein